MKRILYTMTLSMLLGLSSCADTFLDLNPMDTRTDVVYFKKAADFKEYANGFYGQLLGWKSSYGSVYEFMDNSSDLAANSFSSYELGHGTIQIPTNDTRWNNCYANIRAVNILLEKAKSYPGNQTDIKQYLSEAYFFRAYNYFYLLKFFGGVPIVTSVLDVNSPELTNSRNSRYEVIDFILADLNEAIAGLPQEQNIPSTEKGRISYHGAEAFKARVLLYEATWRKYNGTSTDFEGSAKPASNQVETFLAEAISLCEDVMTSGKYAIWNYNSIGSMSNMSSRYLFCLEDAGSNPAGMTKSSNNEFIIYSVYDKSLKPGAINLNQSIVKMDASRKLVDMFLCTDGLPISKSRKFQGYANPGDEFKNRDYRMKSYLFEVASNVVLNAGRSGYTGAKFHNPTRANMEESANYPVLRLAEVYLNYAEAVYEKNGAITDEQLSKSVNFLRKRAGIANLTNDLVTNNGLDMLEEIRRERAIELYMEGFRFDDLKRWGIAEASLNASRCGMIIGSKNYPTVFIDNTGAATNRYNSNTYVWGEETIETPVGTVKCIVVDSKSNCKVAKTHYLWPIPQQQINMNPNLKQNPGYSN